MISGKWFLGNFFRENDRYPTSHLTLLTLNHSFQVLAKPDPQLPTDAMPKMPDMPSLPGGAPTLPSGMPTLPASMPTVPSMPSAPSLGRR